MLMLALMQAGKQATGTLRLSDKTQSGLGYIVQHTHASNWKMIIFLNIFSSIIYYVHAYIVYVLSFR